MKLINALSFICVLLCSLSSWAQHLTDFEAKLLLKQLEALSSEEMAGRKPGTVGHSKAQSLLIKAYADTQLRAFGSSYKLPFTYKFGFAQLQGNNIAGFLEGISAPEKYIVFTAHYDHLGSKHGKVFYGMDDNASGVAAMLHLARYFSRFKPHYSMIFLATDAEEAGLKGAKAFVQQPPVPLEDIVLNINLDMLSQGGRKNILYVAGTRKQPQFKQLIDEVQDELLFEQFRMKRGHDGAVKGFSRSGQQRGDWRQASDHGPFLKRGIPYLYFGVDEHKFYHSPEDTFANLDRDFYLKTVAAINYTVVKIDQLANW